MLGLEELREENQWPEPKNLSNEVNFLSTNQTMCDPFKICRKSQKTIDGFSAKLTLMNPESIEERRIFKLHFTHWFMPKHLPSITHNAVTYHTNSCLGKDILIYFPPNTSQVLYLSSIALNI